jgi:ketosteroid isomerase-like protein
VYHAIVRRRTRQVFAGLSAGDSELALRGLTEDVHHVFPGTSPIGGERRSRDAVRRWFERLARLFPGHEFEVHRVVSRGWPWSTWVAVQWSATMRPQTGAAYVNHGAHWIHLRWGRATAFHAYLDTERIARACEEMARAGVDEAAATPIEG